MATYLVTVAIGSDDPDAKQALLGREAAHLGELHQQGTLPVALLSTDAATAWLVLEAADEEEAAGLVAAFPLAAWFEIIAIEAVRVLQPHRGDGP